MIIRLLLGAIGVLVLDRIIAENARRPLHVARPRGGAKAAPDEGEWIDVSARLDR